MNLRPGPRVLRKLISIPRTSASLISGLALPVRRARWPSTSRSSWLDKAGLVEELGDVVYYWACLCAATGQQPSALLDASAAKIKRRISEAASR